MVRLFIAAILLIMSLMQTAVAVEVAPRISDREIIEALADIRGELKAINQRFESIDQHFESVDQRFESIDQRFESVNQRFDDLHSLMLVILAGIFGLIGFIVWDRRTMIRPLEERFTKLEEELRYDLELQGSEGSKLTRLIHVLRELAQTDPKVAAALKQFSLF